MLRVVINETRLLAYRATKPHLRVVDVVGGTETPCKLLDRASAPMGVVPRSGWIAVAADHLWWPDAKLERRARRLASSPRLAPAIDERCVWHQGDGSSWVHYDGTVDEVRDVVDLGPMVALHVEIPEGLVVWDVGRQTRFVLDREPPHAPLEEIGPGDFVAASGSKTAWRYEGAGLRIHDHVKGTDVVVHDDRIRRWTYPYGECWSVSPDGMTLALSGEGVFGPVDLGIEDRAAAKAKDTLLVFVDLASGTFDIPTDRYEAPGFPVWLADGQHVTFANDRSLHVFDVVARQGTPVSGQWTRPPHPIVDIARADSSTGE